MRLGRPAGARGPRGGDDDDVVGLDDTGCQTGGQGEARGGRVAPGDGDPTSPREVAPVLGAVGLDELGHPVGPGAGEGGVVVVVPVLLVVETEVGSAVDDDDLVGQLLRDGRRVAVGQSEEDDVVVGEHLGGRRLEHAVGKWLQVRREVTEAGARIARCREGTDLDLGMAEQEPSDLGPCVAAGSGDGCGDHLHDHTQARCFMQTRVGDGPWVSAAGPPWRRPRRRPPCHAGRRPRRSSASGRRGRSGDRRGTCAPAPPGRPGRRRRG